MVVILQYRKICILIFKHNYAVYIVCNDEEILIISPILALVQFQPPSVWLGVGVCSLSYFVRPEFFVKKSQPLTLRWGWVETELVPLF